MDINRERQHRQADHHHGPRSCGQDGQPAEREESADRADDASHPNAGGEELEDEQRQTGEQQEVGNRRASHGVEQLIDQRQFREAHDGDRVEARVAIIGDHLLGGDQDDAELLVAVHCLQH